MEARVQSEQSEELPLHETWRPQQWSEVIGQGAAVKVLSAEVARRSSHAYLLIGPSGCGKTTLARIAAMELGAELRQIIEIPAAIVTGVEAMRKIQEGLQYKPITGSVKPIILDECHRLSGNAWDAILKATEEPPPYVFWFFCTTEPHKVPKTIHTRSTAIVLKEIAEKDLGRLYDKICAEENFDIPGDVGDLIIREAQGSARKMLVNLSACRNVKTKKEAAEFLRVVLESDVVTEFCRFLANPGSWQKMLGLLEKLKDENAEGVRIIVQNYFAKACIGARSERDVCHFISVMEAFSQPFNSSENVAPLIRAAGRVMWPG